MGCTANGEPVAALTHPSGVSLHGYGQQIVVARAIRDADLHRHSGGRRLDSIPAYFDSAAHRARARWRTWSGRADGLAPAAGSMGLPLRGRGKFFFALRINPFCLYASLNGTLFSGDCRGPPRDRPRASRRGPQSRQKSYGIAPLVRNRTNTGALQGGAQGIVQCRVPNISADNPTSAFACP